MTHTILRLHLFVTVIMTLLFSASNAQELYFPPLTGEEWATMSMKEAGLCPEGVDSLIAYLDEVDSKAFMLLIDGKIVLEHYFGTFQPDSLWYWASAGKTLTAFAVGMAQETGHLDINDPSRMYLGDGWSSLTDEQEEQLTVRHHLTMTTGLNDGVDESDCTLDTCLVYLAHPGTRWAYHNAPYTLLDQVISGATGQNLNIFLNSVLKSRTGMDGLFVKLGYNNVYFSTPRSMARYGLLILNEGKWADNTVMEDTAYFSAMVNTSQELNPSYGYLWWLNGKSSFMIPNLQLVFDGPIAPAAPADMFAALGYNGQILNIVPSRNLVLLRMGTATSNGAIAVTMNNDIWEYLNAAFCTTSTLDITSDEQFGIYPNPSSTILHLANLEDITIKRAVLIGAAGSIIPVSISDNSIDLSNVPSGAYYLRLVTNDAVMARHVIVH